MATAAKRPLANARAAKQDEFYTQYIDIQKEVEAYLEFDPRHLPKQGGLLQLRRPFRKQLLQVLRCELQQAETEEAHHYQLRRLSDRRAGHVVPEYDEGNGNRKRPKALAVVVDSVKDEDGDGAINVSDVELFLKRNKAARIALKGNDKYPGGDFRSPECVALLREADIVVTNPPFSLFREYVAQLVRHEKEVPSIGNSNAVTYKEVFPLIQTNRVWKGATANNTDMVFAVPKGAKVADADRLKAERLGYPSDDKHDYTRLGNSCWFSTLDHGRRHEPLPLISMADNLQFSKHKEIKGKAAYDRDDNYDAIEVPFTDAIPSDYEGLMGVPITFLDKYNPDQFEILGTSDNGIIDDGFKITPGLTKKFVDDYYKCGGTGAYKEGNPAAGYYENGVAKMAYKRIFIRHRRVAKGTKK